MTCPICRVPLALEVTPGINGLPIYQCRGPRCGFIGDGIELFMAARDLDMEAAAYELISAGVITGGPDAHRELREHMDWYKDSQLFRDRWWDEANKEFTAGSTHAAGILQARGCWQSTIQTMGPQGLGPHLGIRQGHEIKELVERSRRLYMLQDWKHYLIVPIWGDPRTLTGLSCFDETGDACYIPLEDGNPHSRTDVHGFGFLRTTRAADPFTLIVNHPVVALELLAGAQAEGMELSIVYATELTNTWAYLFPRKRLFLNFNSSLETYRHALKDPGSLVVSGLDMRKPIPVPMMTPRGHLDYLVSLGRPVHCSLGEYLTSLTYTEAKTSVQRLELKDGDVARVLSSVPELQRGQLNEIFAELQEARAVFYNGDTISIVDGGWTALKKGRISNTVFLIDKVVCDSWNNQQLAYGIVIQGTKQFQFTAPLQEIQKKTDNWLQGVLNEQQGGLLVVAPGWSNKLYHLSLQFRTPTTEHSAVGTGWANDFKRLVFPGITIENGQITASSGGLKGPGAGFRVPGDLGTWDLGTALEDTEANAMFWALVAAITVNVFGPVHTHGSFGVAIVDPKGAGAERVLNGAVDAIGIERVSFALGSTGALKEIRNKETKGVLPIFIDELWATSRGFMAWQRLEGNRNALVAMPRPVAVAASLAGGWAYVSPRGIPETADLTVLQGLWGILPTFWAWIQTAGLPWERTRGSLHRGVLLSHVEAWVRSLGYENPKVLQRAADRLSVDTLGTAAPWGYRFLGLLVDCIKAGGLQTFKVDDVENTSAGVLIDERGEFIFISRVKIQEIFQGLGMEAPGHQDILNRLQEASCLVGPKFRGVPGYAIPLDRWNLCWSCR